MTVVTTTSRERAVFKDMNGGPCIRVRKGCYVRVDSADAFSTLWNSWTTVARARILAVCVSAHREPVLVGISSLVARSIPLWEANPDVVAWFGARRPKRKLPTVKTPVATVPAANVCSTTSRPREEEIEVVDGLQ